LAVDTVVLDEPDLSGPSFSQETETAEPVSWCGAGSHRINIRWWLPEEE